MNSRIKDYSQEYLEYQSGRSTFRKLIKKLYSNDIRKSCLGKTIDLGCGIGDFLRILPPDSIGLEINEFAVNYCKSKGLKVYLYDPQGDDYRFSMVEKDMYSTFSMNHVLEHLENPANVIHKIFESCYRLGISRIVFTVPGIKGFKAYESHLTFVDLNYLKENGILDSKYFLLRRYKYFPFNLKMFGRLFIHNELRLIFERIN